MINSVACGVSRTVYTTYTCIWNECRDAARDKACPAPAIQLNVSSYSSFAEKASLGRFTPAPTGYIHRCWRQAHLLRTPEHPRP